MGVYVDELFTYGNGKGFWKNRKSCHLIADSVDELKTFAVSIGLKVEWFQPKSSPHFDLTEGKRKQAIAKGATQLNRKQFVQKLQEIRLSVSIGTP